MNKTRKLAFLMILSVLLLTACAGQKMSTRSSVMDYLYADVGDKTIEPTLPQLSIPLKLGIAFVPESSRQAGYGVKFWSDGSYSNALTESKKIELLNSVAANFKELDFIKSIEVIPSTYLRAQGGFDNLTQLKNLYGIDVVALVSHDQVQFTDEGFLSLSYWTVIGAYVVSGEKNDTNTLLDTVVYDIDSRALLFRAPGTSHVKGSSTLVNLSEELRQDSLEGFELATVEMIGNLQVELDKFKQAIKDNPEKAKVSYRSDYSGAGSFFLLELLVLAVFVLGRRRRNIRQ